MRVDLPEDKNGDKQWAELTDLEDVTRRTKFKLTEAYSDLWKNHSDEPILVEEIFKDLLIAHLVTDWTFGSPPNKDPEPVRDLATRYYDPLVEATQPYREDLDFMKTGKAALEKARQSEEPAGTSGSRDGSEATSSQDTNPTPA